MARVKQTVAANAGERKTRFFNEYLFHEIVESVNETRKQSMQPVITISHARDLRDRVLTELQKQDKNFNTCTKTMFCDTVNQVFASEQTGTSVISKSDYDDYFKVFTGLTKWSGKDGAVDSLVPISPYDNRFADKETVMKNGSRLLYLDGDAINFANGRFAKPNIVLHSRDYRGNVTDIGPFTTQGDKSGMARLLRYIPEKDYQALADWVNSAPEDMYMSKDAVDRSVAILSYLQNSGYEYEIQKDRKPGQLKAMIKGTHTNVRIADTKNNDAYIGSVYDDGRRIYFATTPSKEKLTVQVTPEDAVNLLKFSLGESVERQDMKGTVGAYGTYKSGQYVRPNSYHTNSGYSAIYKSIPNPQTGRDGFDRMTIHVDNRRDSNALNFHDGQEAEEYLKGVISNARMNFESLLDVDHLVKEAKDHAGDESYVPQFSGDSVIASIQQSYWDVLSEKQTTLLKPGVSMAEYQDAMDVASDVSLQGIASDWLTKDMYYDGTPEEIVRAHMLDTVNTMIGQFDLDADHNRFDPANVSLYMTSGEGVYRNNDNLIKAMREMNLDPNELKGNSFNNESIKTRLIRFDAASAKPMAQSGNPFVRSMYDTIKSTLTETGCNVLDQDILMDANGIVQYKGTRTRNWKSASSEPITGQIGQIFVPDDLGMVETKFAGDHNYIFVPGYNATVVPQKEGENLTLEERTRLRGYEQEMKKSLAYQIRSDLMTTDTSIGEPTSVNRVHHQLYDTRYPVDVIERAQRDGMRPDVFQAIVKTLSRRVRYSNDFKEGSTINADYQANRDTGFNDIANDNFADPYRLSGRRNMSVMTEDAFGYFDPMATSTSTNQGIVRFLTESATVAEDGRIIKGDEADRTPIMKIEEMRYAEYSPFDRNQMVFSNLLTARAIADDVHTAQMTFGGWTFDDGYVVSKEFAEKYPIRDTEGNLRTMVKGDKICDFGGNKGVISLVVDRDMTVDRIEDAMHVKAETDRNITCEFRGVDYTFDLDSKSKDSAKTQAAFAIQEKLGYKGCDEAIRWFQANPELEVVGAPFPAVSRFNATSDKMLMEHPQDLYGPDGKKYEGCMGTTSFIITDMPVDEKTHNYGDSEVAEGKGRKASSQFAWALASQDALAVLDDCYATNSSATANLRETLITMGLDMSPTGKLLDHYEPHPNEQRKVFEMPKLEYRQSGDKTYLNLSKMRQDFGNLIQNSGGVLEIPFELEFPSGGITPPLNDGKTDVIYKEVEWERKGYTRKDGTYVKPTIVHRKTAETVVGDVTYGLPVMSSYLRSGQEFSDGTVSTHDYTNQYLSIYEASCRYRDEKAKGDACNEALLTQYQSEAQRSFNQITMDVRSRMFDNNKHNVFKDSIMSNRLAHSATAVWTADPRLDIDEVAMGPETAKALDVKDGEYTLLWRDPMLRDAGIRDMRVKLDETLVGVAINPAVDKGFDGDFDGDSVGLANLRSARAKSEAFEKLSFDANLLDYGALKSDENGNDHYSILVQDGLDLASAYYAHPELAERRQALEDKINQFESDASMDVNVKRKLRKEAVSELSDHIKGAFAGEFGTDMISYKDNESHLRSIAQVVDHKAKGSYKKLGDYMKYMGWEADMLKDESGKIVGIDFDTLKDMGHTNATYTDAMAVMYATAIKAFGTGVAGKYSQRGVAALRNVCPKAVLEMTYPNTQGILQAKHDPIDARHRYEMLMTSARDLWRGYKLERKSESDGLVHWTTVRDSKTKAPIMATPEEFKAQFLDIYGDAGFDCAINSHYIDDIAKALTDETTGKIINMEKDELTSMSTLDKLTYGGGFDALCEAARKNEALFDGKYTSHFAPSNIRKNMEIERNRELGMDEGKTVRGIVKSDVKADAVKTNVKSSMAISVGGARRLPDGVEDMLAASDEKCSEMGE